ncbi:MAG: sulfite exporter TauE/SafE family protein, partial [Ilumatobacter sp.]|nr:sulfite exporter TauE/SafE family protein [Ilumatobacter sp.]
MRALFASPLGFVIGLSLGALGGGGSILAIPALVYGAGQGAKPASATSLILVAITSAIGLLPHWRAGRVRWGAGLLFGLAGSGAALLGGWMASGVNGDLLLLLFSGVMVAAAVMMWRRARPGSTHAATTGSAVITVDAGTVVKVLVAGSVVGMLTGFFGVGGGFVIVPMLVLALGFSMPEAVGTSLVV